MCTRVRGSMLGLWLQLTSDPALQVHMGHETLEWFTPAQGTDSPGTLLTWPQPAAGSHKESLIVSQNLR